MFAFTYGITQEKEMLFVDVKRNISRPHIKYPIVVEKLYCYRKFRLLSKPRLCYNTNRTERSLRSTLIQRCRGAQDVPCPLRTVRATFTARTLLMNTAKQDLRTALKLATRGGYAKLKNEIEIFLRLLE